MIVNARAPSIMTLNDLYRSLIYSVIIRGDHAVWYFLYAVVIDLLMVLPELFKRFKGICFVVWQSFTSQFIIISALTVSSLFYCWFYIHLQLTISYSLIILLQYKEDLRKTLFHVKDWNMRPSAWQSVSLLTGLSLISQYTTYKYIKAIVKLSRSTELF